MSRQDCKISIVRLYANINRKRFREILSRNCMSKNVTVLAWRKLLIDRSFLSTATDDSDSSGQRVGFFFSSHSFI